MRKELSFAAALLCMSMAATAAVAQDGAGSKTVAGLTVYLGVLPATMIEGNAKEHAEEAHGGIPRGPHAYHVMAAVFDAETGERVENVAIEARVTPFGLAPVTRRLEPMAIAGTVTYGNYFTMRGDGPYQITFIVTAPHRTDPVVVEFSYEHRTR
jgi:hypothetical protein